jgi:hypothetical protein
MLKRFEIFFFLVNPPKNEYWLEQFFIKLPSPWDEMSRNSYPEFLNKLEKPDYLGYRINYVLRLITEQCLLVKVKAPLPRAWEAIFACLPTQLNLHS